MRKLLKIMAMVIAITQTPIPIPGQTANTGASQAHTATSKGPSGQHPATKVPSPAGSISPTGATGQSGPANKNPEDNKYSVSVRELPAVSVNRDWVDFWTFGVSCLLALIGVGGVCAAVKTLRSINKQVHQMRVQNRLILRQAKVLINSERAWVLIEVDQGLELIQVNPPLAVNPPITENRFEFTMTNSGRTVARLKKLQATTFCIPEDGTVLPLEPVYFPQDDFPPERCGVLAPGEAGGLTSMRIRRPIDANEIDRIKRGTSKLYIFGRLEYYDFAHTERVLQFCYQYTSDAEREKQPQQPPARWMLTLPSESVSHVPL